jgi:hypothetical protein
MPLLLGALDTKGDSTSLTCCAKLRTTSLRSLKLRLFKAIRRVERCEKQYNSLYEIDMCSGTICFAVRDRNIRIHPLFYTYFQ